MDRPGARAVSSTVGTVMMVAVVVVVAAATATFALSLSDRLDGAPPQVAQSDDELVADDTEQYVRIYHEVGDTVDVGNIEIVVDAGDACGKRSRIVNLPTDTLGPANFEGDDIFSYFSPEDGVLEESADGEFSAGDVIQFRLASSECDIDPGEQVVVRIVHLPSDTVIVERTLIATEPG